jgi:hypothetical protein
LSGSIGVSAEISARVGASASFSPLRISLRSSLASVSVTRVGVVFRAMRSLLALHLLTLLQHACRQDIRILTTLPQDDLAAVPAAARAAEAAGYDGVVTSENRHDPFLSRTAASTTSSR